jgi:cytochrome P450
MFSSDTGRVVPAAQRFSAGNLLQTDPPRHHQLRRLVGAAFSPKVITGLAPRIAELTHELLDATDGASEFDLISVLAYPLPVTVIAELLGLPASDRELFRTWADKLLTVLEGADPNDPQLAQNIDEATAEMLAYLHEHCVDRRAHPREDLISRLATVEADGQRLTDEEVVNFSTVLLIAGHITTTALLGNTVLCLDAHPEVAAELHADRSLVEATLEEVLRYRSSFTQVIRVTMAETELGGQTIPADALVTPWLLSANRDEREFPDPDRFDIHRSPPPPGLRLRHPLLHRPATGPGGGQGRGRCVARPIYRDPSDLRGTAGVLWRGHLRRPQHPGDRAICLNHRHETTAAGPIRSGLVSSHGGGAGADMPWPRSEVTGQGQLPPKRCGRSPRKKRVHQ